MQQVEKILIQEESILLKNMHRKGNEVDSKVHLIESSTWKYDITQENKF